MPQINEKKFYQALENIFVGANIEGDSGYVNLLKIKSQYYKIILEQFKKEVDQNKTITDSFKEEFFDRLFSFFEKYFSESGSVYFTKTANWQRVYEQVYTDNKDVVLFWKTHMLYYVKSDVLFQSINVEIDDEETKQNYKFYFDVGNLQAKQNNEKKALLFTFSKKDRGTFVFNVVYSENGRKTKTEDIVKATKIPEAIIEKSFATFKKQSEVDFFINKDAEKFLSEQLDMYLHQILLADENKFNQNRLDQLKTVKEFASKIIQFIAQFENELVRVWNKPKFALDSNYVITIDKLSDEIIKKLEKHAGIKKQITEWVELGIVEKGFDFKKRENKHTYLPIDTKYFKDLEIEILGLFDNLDEALDGRLIHSENYQALNTLQEKYKEKVQCIYIDPPFNTGSDFDYVDNYQDSSWLSIMKDRINLSTRFLNKQGSLFLHLDEDANYHGRILLDDILIKKNELIWNKGFRGTESKKIFQHAHDTVFYYVNSGDYIWNEMSEEYKDNNLSRYNKIDSDGSRYALIKRTRTDGSIYYGKTYPKDSGKSANDVISWIPTMASTNKQRRSFQTQKPEELLQVFVENSTNLNDIVMDFFAGSGTTIATAHKSGRKWVGIDMGEHYNKIILPRMKEVLSGKSNFEPCGISEDVEWKGGGFFKYQKLEQYEDTLRNAKYQESSPADIFDTRKPFEQYIFYADQKFAHLIENKKNEIQLDFEKLYVNIDFAETISNIRGLPIQKITSTGVFLEGEEKEIKTDYKNMTEPEKVEFIKLLKPLLWWGE